MQQHNNIIIMNDDPIMSMFEDMMSGSSSRYSSQKAPQPILPTKVEPGLVCEVDGLKSASGKTLNKRRCAVIRHVTEEDRYEVRMENEKGKDVTFALKEANLSPMEKLVLPTHNRRGSESSAFYSLFIQRLLRLVGREAIGTYDGIKLGKMARAILLKLCPVVNLKKPLTDTDKANHLLDKTSRDLPREWVLDTGTGSGLMICSLISSKTLSLVILLIYTFSLLDIN